MLIFLFKSIELRDKTYKCMCPQSDVQIPYSAEESSWLKWVTISGWKIKLTGIPRSPIVPVNGGISVLFKLSELLN